MTKLELAKEVRKLLDEDVLPNIRGMACDIGRINTLGIECNQIIKDAAEFSGEGETTG